MDLGKKVNGLYKKTKEMVKEKIIFNSNVVVGTAASVWMAAEAAKMIAEYTTSKAGIGFASAVGSGIGFYGTILPLSFFDEKKKREIKQTSFAEESKTFAIKSNVCGAVYTALKFGSTCYFQKKGYDAQNSSVMGDIISYPVYFYLMNKWHNRPLIPESIKPAAEKMEPLYNKAYIGAVELSKFSAKLM